MLIVRQYKLRILKLKKNILNENIQKLEILSKNINESIKKLKKIFTKRNENKEDLKKTIQIRFTKIRKALNDKEEEIISNIEKNLMDYI